MIIYTYMQKACGGRKRRTKKGKGISDIVNKVTDFGKNAYEKIKEYKPSRVLDLPFGIGTVLGETPYLGTALRGLKSIGGKKRGGRRTLKKK